MEKPKTILLPQYGTLDSERLARSRMFADEMASRRTVRDYSPKPVPREVIEACLRTAGAAPSGANQQPWHFVAISNPELKRKIRLAAEQEDRELYRQHVQDVSDSGAGQNESYLEMAPWLIAIFYERTGPELNGHQTKRYHPQESTGIATGFLIVALHKAGLATLTHATSSMAFLNGFLDRPENEVPYLLLVVGHPAEDCRVPDIERKPLSDIADFIE